MEVREYEKFAGDDSFFSRRKVIIDGLEVGYVEIILNNKTKRAHMKFAKLDEKIRGQGYGKKLFLQVGEDLAKEGVVLYMDTLRDLPNEPSIKIWESLVSTGHAKVLSHKVKGEKLYEFIPEK